MHDIRGKRELSHRRGPPLPPFHFQQRNFPARSPRVPGQATVPPASRCRNRISGGPSCEDAGKPPLLQAQGARYAPRHPGRLGRWTPGRPLTAAFPCRGETGLPRRTPTAMCIAFSLWNTYLFRKASGRSRMGCCLDAALPYRGHPAAGPGPSCPSPGQHGVRARPSPPRIREPFPEALSFPAPKEAP